MTTEVIINRQPVELYKLLKFEGLVASGGDAKTVIAEGMVRVNGVVETQKRKKIVDGDRVDFNGESLAIRFDSHATVGDVVEPGIRPPAPSANTRPIRRTKPTLNKPK